MRTLIAVLAVCCSALGAFAGDAKPEFARGEIIPKIITQSDPAQSYALYLPKAYDPARQWPVVFIFDPSANCARPMPQAVKVAEEFGYIAACSNNSKNGASDLQIIAARAMLTDVATRFAVDPARSYTAGFSGGARVASAVAQLCRPGCIKGAFLNGAGFSVPQGPSKASEAPFDVFIAVGDLDPNYHELLLLSRRLDGIGVPYRMSVFSGPHQWAPDKQWHEAFAWFELRAAKGNSSALKPDFIQAQATETQELVNSLADAGQLTQALALAKQSAEDFAGSPAAAAFKKRADELVNDKRLNDVRKREDAELAQQESLVASLFQAMRAAQAGQVRLGGPVVPSTPNAAGPVSPTAQPRGFSDDADSTNSSGQELQSRVRALRERREKGDEREKKVITRALTSVFISAFEGGQRAMEEKNYKAAEYWFDIASTISLKPAPMYVQIAGAQLARGDRKAALRSIKKALDTDAATAEMIQTSDNLASLRSNPEFNKLLTSHAAGAATTAK